MAIPFPVPRAIPYTSATWLSKAWRAPVSLFRLVQEPLQGTGQEGCQPRAWTAEHTAMVHDAAAEFRAEGYEVYLEEQNSIGVRGSGGAVLAGKPDIVAVRDDTAIVVDCKTGQPRTSDSLQERLYMYLLGQWSTHPAKNCRRIVGEVRYRPDKGDSLDLPHAAADGVAELMRRNIRVLLSPTPPLATPSLGECRFCELAGGVCMDAVSEEPAAVAVGWFLR